MDFWTAKFSVEVFFVRLAYFVAPRGIRFSFLKALFSEARKSDKPIHYRMVIRKAMRK